MTEYPISVAGIFLKQGAADPICSICFFATEPPSTSTDEVESYICSIILPELAQIVPNSSVQIVMEAIRKYAVHLEALFDIDCQGYLNETYLRGSPKKQGLGG